MAVVDAVALVEHVVGLGRLRIVGAVLVNVGAYVGQEVRSVASLLEGAAQADKVTLVGGKLLAQEGEIVLLEGRGCEGGFRVKQSGEL